jgi:hypothetical protein
MQLLARMQPNCDCTQGSGAPDFNSFCINQSCTAVPLHCWCAFPCWFLAPFQCVVVVIAVQMCCRTVHDWHRWHACKPLSAACIAFWSLECMCVCCATEQLRSSPSQQLMLEQLAEFCICCLLHCIACSFFYCAAVMLSLVAVIAVG